METRPTIFVVDDDTAVRDSIAELGRMMGCFVQGYTSAAAFLREVNSNHPGCLVLDIRMPDMNGLELQVALMEAAYSLPVIIVTGHGDVPMTVRAIKAGAVDFLEKPFSPEELVCSIRDALDLDARQREQRKIHNEVQTQIARLSDGERRVLRGVADGKTNSEIAEELDISLRTVQFRRANIKKQLRIETKSEMVQLAQRAMFAKVDSTQFEEASHNSKACFGVLPL